jgi:glyoxylase-like metal-dependent hydrolase (beta-lactamase superfamily II)
MEEVEKINKADSLIFQTERQLKEYGDKIPADKKQPIEDALAELRKSGDANNLYQTIQDKEKGYDKNAADIKYVIISHFHADHISGIKDFQNAEFICSKDAYETVIKSKGINAVRKGILHNLLPLDFNTRVKFIEDFADTILVNEFGITQYGVFGIQNWRLILLPGHAKGMLGFIFQDDKESLLYATDASWNYDVYKKGILPKKVVKLFFDSWNEFIDTQQKLKAFELNNVNYKILFTHCPQTLKYVSNEI